MGRPSLSQRRAKHIVERSGADRFRRGAFDRLEVGSDGLFERTEGSRVLRVGDTLSERVGGTHTTRARRVERTVRGRTRIDGRADTILLGGAMSDVHAGAELVLAGMSDDLLLGAGARVTAPLDLWLTGLMGLEEKLATSAFDGAVVDTARTVFEREYATGVHNAGSATFSGAVYATQATGFRRLMKVSNGVRNLSSGGGGGSASESASSSGPSCAAASPGGSPEPGLLGSAQAPRPGSAGSDSVDLAGLAGEAQSTEDAAHYQRAEDVSETVSDLQETARNQVAGESPEEAARAPSRVESAEGPAGGSSPDGSGDAGPAAARPDPSTPAREDALQYEPAWAPPSTHERTYTKGQVSVGQSFDEFRFDAVVGARPDKLLSDDAQASMDTAAFRIVYDARQEVTDMAHEAVRHADPRMNPASVSEMTAVEAHEYLAGLRNAAVEAGDTEEARRLQGLIDELDHYAFDRYLAGIADAEATHEMTPMKLPSHVDSDALEQRLRALAEEQFARMDDPGLSDAERHEASKLGGAYMMAAQDTSQGLDPLAHVQAVLDSGLDQADAPIYNQVASQITGFTAPVAIAATARPSARSLWARAGDIASSLLSFVRFDSHLGSGVTHADELSEASPPIRFLDSPTGLRVPDPDPPPDAAVHAVEFDADPFAGEVDPSPVGPDSARTAPPSGVPEPRSAVAPRLSPTLDGDGAHWADPKAPPEGSGTPTWAQRPDTSHGTASSGPSPSARE